MAINMINNFSFEGDTREDFVKALRVALELSFRAGRNEEPKYHNIQVTPANGNDVDYWLLEKDKYRGSTLVCSVKQCYYPERDHLVSMSFEDENDRGGKVGETLGVVNKRDRLVWTRKSYDNLENVIMGLVDSTKLIAEVPRWMDDGDGSTGNEGLGFVFRSSSPDTIYVYKTHVYYGK